MSNQQTITSQSAKPQLIRVAVPCPLRRTFDYWCPASSILPPIGARVLVPFARQKLVAMVIDHPQHSDIDASKLKSIHQVIDDQPLLPSSLHKLMLWAAKYYQHPIGEVFATCLPTLLNKGEAATLQAEYQWRLTELGKKEKVSIRKNAIKQLKIMQLAEQHQGLITAWLLKSNDLTVSDLKPFMNKQWLAQEIIEPQQADTVYEPVPSPYNLNSEQIEAIKTISQSFNSYQGFVLDGVTGSGKTEVYLQLIDKVLAQGKQALLLVPEIGLTPQTVKRFEQRFNVPVAMLHSGLTDRQRLNIWLQAKQGLTSIIIGTRSALFTPLKNPGLLVIDEEHDLSYKQQDGFRYSARDLALLRAQFEQMPIVLGSATPAMESLYNAKQGKLKLLKLRKRAANAKPPHIKVLDVRQRHLNQGLSQPLIDNMRRHLEAGNQCMIFLNRRGYAPSLLCHDCGWIADCSRCDRHMTYHHRFKRLHCHHCDRQVFMPKQCPECGESELLPIGLGTERLEEVLKQQFPDKTVLRIDRDTTRRKDAMQQFVSAIKNDEVDILVGTQMLAKGHHFPKLTCVGVIDIDGCLFSADFRAAERTAQLLTQVAGRAGRAEQKGEVIIQTHHPEHPLLIDLFTQDYQSLSDKILEERQAAMLPPYYSMAILRAEANDLALPMQFLSDVAQKFTGYQQAQCYGPFPAPMPKRAGKMRAQLLVQAADRKTLQSLLTPNIPLIEELPSARKVRWSIDVDPQEVF
ncbi:MAG: primosomal protein N' [Kangiellaceae bacterium]|nr:primosomal protein N' [Kangiellaceae bacterium]